MIQVPFFSIVIPTRNRPKLFRDALQSALLQDFDDFEVIVSDNSTDQDTQVVIREFRNHPRLSVCRPDQHLSMPKHWEFATLKANGRYVLVLPDRSVLKRDALRYIHSAICSSKQDVLICSWRWSLFDERLNIEFSDHPTVKRGEVSNVSSSDAIRNFTAWGAKYPYDLPRGLNSCYRYDLAEEIRRKYGELFLPISPDFTSAFLLLAHAENVLFLDTALFISQGLGVSNGGTVFRSASANDAYMSTLGAFDCYAHVPIKKPLTINLIFEDFLAMQEKVAGNLLEIPVDWTNYFSICYRELLEKKAISSNGSKEYASWMDEWERALSTFDSATQQKVKRQIARPNGIGIKALLKSSPFALHLLQRKRWFEDRKMAGTSVLNHAGFENPTHGK